MLRAHAAAAADVDRAHDKQLHAVDLMGVFFGNIGNEGVELEEFIGLVRAGALLDERAHFGDGDDGIDLLLAHAKRKAQVGVRIDVRSQHGAALVGVKPRQRGGERRFADAALAGDRELHTQMPSAARFCSMRSIMRSPSFSMSVSTV